MPHIYVHICMAHMHAACICALLLAGRACNILFCLSCVGALCVLLSLLFPVVVYLGGMNVPARHRGCMRRIVSLNTLELGCLRTIHTACKQQRNILYTTLLANNGVLCACPHMHCAHFCRANCGSVHYNTKLNGLCKNMFNIYLHIIPPTSIIPSTPIV